MFAIAPVTLASMRNLKPEQLGHKRELSSTLIGRNTLAFAVALLLCGALAAAQNSQPTPPSKTTATTTPHRNGTRTTSATRAAGAASAVPLPPGIPRVAAPLHIAYALRFQEIRLGTGPLAQPGQVYTVHYTGWLASDGTRFDSSYDHQDAQNPSGQPIQFLQGRHRVIPGWDTGFAGMRIGGKRRLFIPYQLAYGDQGRPPVIPPHSDLIFDVELVNAADLPQPPQGMPYGQPVPNPANQPGANTPNAPQSPPAPHAPPQPQAPPTPPDR
uniref:peptidylprolyl isomerase n=1 Tax=mine drainage metagenome TaxID=410659 RepID=E6Q064_9ZZZZ